MNDDIDISNSCFYIGDCDDCNCADVCPYCDSDHHDEKVISTNKK